METLQFVKILSDTIELCWFVSGSRRRIDLMPGKKYASIKRPAVYEALRRDGASKEKAAKIANSKAKKRR